MKIWKRVCAQVLIVVCIFSQMGDYVSASTVEKSSPIGIIEESNKEASIIEVEETKQPEKTTEPEKEPEQSESVKVQSVTEIYVDSAEQLQSEHEYANNSDITWIYQNEEAGKLKVTFSEQTQVENGSDFIYVYDANGTQLGSYTGSQLASKTVEVLGDTIKVRLVSDDSTSAYGLSVDHIAAMESIEVQSMPSVTETIIGEFFDFDGLSVVGIYDDTSKEDITKLCNLGTYDVSTKGEKEISVEFSGLYTSFAMYCKEVKFTAIKVKELPKKSFVYYKGKVDLEGLKVVAVDSLGTEYEIDNGYTMSKINTNIVGTQNVTVNYQGLTTSFDMEVKYAFLYTLNSTFIEIKGIENSSVKEVYIPEMVEGLPVRSIANSAFSGKTNLEYVELPNSITSMGNSVFYGCTGLKNVNIPDKLTYIPHYTFYNCKSLKKVMIPENVLAIEDRAFYGCSGIETLTIPVSTTVYRNYYEREGSFYYCSGIKTLHLTKGTGKMTEYNASSPTSSGVSKYYYDRPWHYSTGNLTTVTIAEEIENIGAYAFYNCAAVKELVLPESITEVGASSFASCGALAKINIPNEIKFIPSNAFSYDKSLLEVVIPEGVTSIGYSAFYECTSLQSVNIPEGITAIYGTTFYNCKELKEVVIPDGVTEIGDRAFYGCSGIETLTIPVSATVYRNYNERAGSFYYCSGIKTLNLTKGTGKMAEYTATSPTNSGVSKYYYDRPWHYSVGNLTTVTIEEGIENIGSYAFRDALKIESLIIPSTVKTVGDYAFYNCAAVKEFVLPESITEIGASSFASCGALTKINIPNGIKFIPSNAFSYDKSLLEVVIPEGVTSIGYSAFYECTSLQSVNIPEGITAIYSTTFYNCKKLKEVVIPDSVTEIGDRAFYGCSGIETLTIPVSATVYRNYNERAGSFYYCSGIKTLNLTKGTGKMAEYTATSPTNSGVSTYYYDRPWHYSVGNLTTVTIEEGIENIGSYAFRDALKVESLTIPSTVETVGDYAFYNCAAVKEFVLPESITEIGASSFSSCEALAKINIPNGIKFIPSNAFSYDKSLLEVVIPEGVTSIGYSAFYECTSLQSVNIPEEITAIYSTTFYNCKKLKEVVIPDSVTEIGDRAFYGCSGIETLTIPVSATVYRNYNERAGSFYYCSGIKTLHLTTGTGKMADYNTANPTSSGVSKYYYDRPWNFSAGNLTTVTIEEGIEHIGAHAFYACSNLEVLEVPDSVRSIGENAFSYCAKLKIFANTGTPAYNYAKANNVPVYSTESITVDTKKITLYTNNTHQLTTTVKMLSGQIDSAATPSWFSSDLTVAGVSDTGVITANGPGRARITATYEGRSVDCEVTVLLTSTSVQLSKVMLELEKSQKATLYATLIPNNSTDMITWESTNPEIASVDNAGRICALQGGVAIITATTESGMVAACTVKVKVKASSVTLDHEEITLYQGESFKLQADMQPYDATDLVAWESSDASIASVDQNGIITTLKKGQATITATTDSGETAQCIVKVKVPVESITLNHTELKLELQDTCKLVADIYPADVEEQISWESSNHDVACVTQDGQVKAVGIGNADITIWVGEKFKATCQVSVEKIDISKFTFTLPSTEYEYSGKGILPEVMNDNGLVVDRDYSVKYSNFTNAGRATVVITGLGDYTGLKEISYMITAKSIQTASISLSSVNYAYTGKAITPGVTLKLLGSTLKNNVDYAVSYHNNTAVGRGEVRVTGKGNYKGSISCQFNIQPKLSTSAQQVYVGGDFTLKVAGGSGTIAWKSSDSKIATVSSTGKVVAKKAGTIVITATRNKVAVTCKVTVKNLALNKTEITKYNGETIALQVIGGTGSIKWSTSNKSIATVSSGGVVTGKKKGTAIISATRNGTTMKCKVTIKEQELSKKTLSLKVKGSSTLKVTGGSGNIKWSTSNKSVATVTSKGVVQGKKKGTATITAIRNGVKMTCKVTVKA